jgi:1,6-anhydro-N-acetylmuramate kinase
VLSKLIHEHQVAGKATAAPSVCRLDLVALTLTKFEGLLAIGAVDVLDLAGQLRHILGDAHRSLPDLLGDVQILSGADGEGHASHVHEVQRQDLEHGRLAGLTGHEENHRAESERSVRQQLQSVDQEPPLPWEQR